MSRMGAQAHKSANLHLHSRFPLSGIADPVMVVRLYAFRRALSLARCEGSLWKGLTRMVWSYFYESAPDPTLFLHSVPVFCPQCVWSASRHNPARDRIDHFQC